MLEVLHVKNLALIEEAELELGKKLNILSGETGAGKSILLGSINLALGNRADKNMIRNGAEYASVELVFTIDERNLENQIKDLGIFPEDHRVILSRKIMDGKSQSRINGELVNGATLKQISSLLIDIHGQHEHQSLLNEDKHLTVLDGYGKSKLRQAKEDYEKTYGVFLKLQERKDYFSADETGRMRQIDLLNFEVNEIKDADITVGEEEELSTEQRRLSFGRQIQEGLDVIYTQLSEGGSDAISTALKSMGEILDYDEKLSDLSDQLYNLESLIQDAAHSAKEQLDHVEVDEERLYFVEERLSLLSSLTRKYGGGEEHLRSLLEEKQQELSELLNFEEEKVSFEAEYSKIKNTLKKQAKTLHELREDLGKEFSKKLEESLTEMNFLDARFSVNVEETGHYQKSGDDHVQFLISANPGEPLLPLSKIASGGELSRIMLAIKALTAEEDQIPTLIFDEIDTGISGKTAAAVADKMEAISGNHQVICISHLPQIVAMADTHFLIEKSAEKGSTATHIQRLSEEGSITELARLLGSSEVTRSSLENAREMKQLAKGTK